MSQTSVQTAPVEDEEWIKTTFPLSFTRLTQAEGVNLPRRLDNVCANARGAKPVTKPAVVATRLVIGQ